MKDVLCMTAVYLASTSNLNTCMDPCILRKKWSFDLIMYVEARILRCMQAVDWF
jgi:hypothetical protein